VWLLGGVGSFRSSLGALTCERRGEQKKEKVVVGDEGCLSDFCRCLCATRQELLLNRQVGGRSIWGNANGVT